MAQPRPPRQRQADLALSIRRARPAEAGRLTEIAFAAKAVWGYPPSFMARCRAALAVDAADILPRLFHLAEAADGEVLGFYGFEPEPGGIGLSHLFVAPAAIGRGVGRALWGHAVAGARRLEAKRLIVVSDPNAAGFYLRMGAEPVGGRLSEVEPERVLPVFRLWL
jgi:GNAT superfamily N-acetyltransferase